MMNLESFTDQDLQAELKRREAARREEELQARRDRFALIVKHRKVLLEFVPHGRTSCSDTDANNGLGSSDYGARCNRCALMQIDEFDATAYDVDFQLNFKRLAKGE